jgi:radical SAM-linked protein
VRDTVIRSVRGTGYDQFSLSSLNTGEYGAIQPVMFDLMDRFEPEKVSISLSSMHASTITPELAAQVRRVRKSGFTIAPEAGTQRLRDVINKNLSEQQILDACRLAFEAGWDHVKLYFMLGLPTETDADVDGMVDLAHAIAAIGRRVRGRTRGPLVTMSASSFIPKAETPFQWMGMERLDELYRKQDRIAARVRRGVRFKHHRGETSFYEGVFSRGDRKLGDVLEAAWRSGARFDGWDEHFKLDAWVAAFRKVGIDPEPYAYRDLDPAGALPWQVVDSRVNRKWLAIELQRAMKAATLSVCGPRDCHGCAPFARECVRGVVAATTDRPLDVELPMLSTPAAPGPGAPTRAEAAPALAPRAADRPAVDTRPRQRYRARFSKQGRLRFLGHLDLSRMLLRGLRRAGISLVYSQGFNPKPRVAFGPALSVGIGSEGEYLDFDTYDTLDADSALQRINEALPAGTRFVAMRPIGRGEPSLGEAVVAARYRVRSRDGALLDRAVESFRGRPQVQVRRATKSGKLRTFDLRREVLDLELLEGQTLRLTLALRAGGASVRPEEVLRELLGETGSDLELVREELLVDWNGRMVNPLLAASASHVHRAAG